MPRPVRRPRKFQKKPETEEVIENGENIEGEIVDIDENNEHDDILPIASTPLHKSQTVKNIVSPNISPIRPKTTFSICEDTEDIDEFGFHTVKGIKNQVLAIPVLFDQEEDEIPSIAKEDISDTTTEPRSEPSEINPPSPRRPHLSNIKPPRKLRTSE